MSLVIHASPNGVGDRAVQTLNVLTYLRRSYRPGMSTHVGLVKVGETSSNKQRYFMGLYPYFRSSIHATTHAAHHFGFGGHKYMCAPSQVYRELIAPVALNGGTLYYFDADDIERDLRILVQIHESGKLDYGWLNVPDGKFRDLVPFAYDNLPELRSKDEIFEEWRREGWAP